MYGVLDTCTTTGLAIICTKLTGKIYIDFSFDNM